MILSEDWVTVTGVPPSTGCTSKVTDAVNRICFPNNCCGAAVLVEGMAATTVAKTIPPIDDIDFMVAPVCPGDTVIGALAKNVAIFFRGETAELRCHLTEADRRQVEDARLTAFDAATGIAPKSIVQHSKSVITHVDSGSL